jgi:hypothetical protein
MVGRGCLAGAKILIIHRIGDYAKLMKPVFATKMRRLSVHLVEFARSAYVLYLVMVGRLLIYAGLALVVLGILVTLGERLPIRFGRLPGDLVLRGKHTTFYFPIVTCLIVSLVLTLIGWLFSRRW